MRTVDLEGRCRCQGGMDAIRDLSCASLQVKNITTRLRPIIIISNNLNKKCSIYIYMHA
jgi:hypothetical protein